MITTDFDLGYQARGPRGGIIMIGSERVPVSTEDAVPTMIEIARRLVREPRGPVTRRTRGTPEVPLGPIGSPRRRGRPARPADPRTGGGRPADLRRWPGGDHPLARSGPPPRRRPPGRAHGRGPGGGGRIALDHDQRLRRRALLRERADRDTVARPQRLAQAGAAVPCRADRIISGCERRCGAPNHDHLDLVAPTEAETLARYGPAGRCLSRPPGATTTCVTLGRSTGAPSPPSARRRTSVPCRRMRRSSPSG